MKIVIGIALLLGLLGCKDPAFNNKLKRALKDDPTILTEAVEAHPAEFLMALQKSAQAAQAEMGKKREEEEQKKLENAYSNPLKAKIRSDETIRGNKNAPIVLVEYSDFECPYCSRGFNTVMELMKKYGDKIQFVFKHLPLSFHQHAMIAAKYYEALRLQKPEMAFKFHDEIFKDQSKLKNGENYLKALAKKFGADMKKLEEDLKSKKVTDRIEEDQKEAAKFEIEGTPGFIINGIPVKGAYPSNYFVDIVEQLKKRGELKI